MIKAFQDTFLKDNSSTFEYSTTSVKFEVTLPDKHGGRQMVDGENAGSSRKHACFMITAETNYLWTS